MLEIAGCIGARNSTRPEIFMSLFENAIEIQKFKSLFMIVWNPIVA